MAVKSNFAAGEILTASNVNTYLTNGGLVYITQVTATSGTTVDVTSVFSSSYDAYRFVISDFRTPAGASVTMQLMNGTTPVATNYAWAYARTDYTGTSVPTASGFPAYVAQWATQCTVGNPANEAIGFTFDLLNPYLAQVTYLQINSQDSRGTSGYGLISGGGTHYARTSYDGLRMTLTASTIQNIKIRVYGYRQA
jgi:hypothetical protein